jgi:hypothetical protein
MNYIKDKNGRIVGRIMQSDNNTKKAYDATGAFVGVYNESTDITMDSAGRVHAYGNTLADLIFENAY